MSEWNYDDVNGCAVGTMICGTCGMKITEGEFRYRKKSRGGDWRYVQHHRACCSDDPEWRRRDAAKDSEKERQEAFIAACVEFRNKWGIHDLDNYIPEPHQ